jgi:hypothetical protein
MVGRFNLDPFRKLALGQLAHLVAPFCQHLQKAVLLLGVPVGLGLAGVEQLGRAFHGQLEARFGEVTHGGFHNDQELPEAF